MNFSTWVKKHIGKSVDYDGSYGVQCVDLVNSFADEVLDIKGCFYGLDYAKEIWTKRNSLPKIKNNFIPIFNTPDFIPREGDIFVRSSGKYGHTGVINNSDGHEFFTYEQNYNGNYEPMSLIKHTEWRYFNFLRPKFQKINANGGLNCYNSMKSLIKAVTIPNGTSVEIVSCNCGQKKIKGRWYQMQIIKYKDKLYYCADKYFTV